MRVNDAVLGLVLALFAAGVIGYASTFPAMPGQRYGPALFPTLIGTGIAVCGVVLIVQGLRAHRLSGGQLVAWPASRGGRLNVAIIVAVLLFYIVAVEDLGFIPTGMIVLAPLLVRLGSRPLPGIAIAFAATLVIHALFSKLLLVPLPWGVLQPIAW